MSALSRWDNNRACQRTHDSPHQIKNAKFDLCTKFLAHRNLQVQTEGEFETFPETAWCLDEKNLVGIQTLHTWTAAVNSWCLFVRRLVDMAKQLEGAGVSMDSSALSVLGSAAYNASCPGVLLRFAALLHGSSLPQPPDVQSMNAVLQLLHNTGMHCVCPFVHWLHHLVSVQFHFINQNWVYWM